ncbi:MAG: acetyltransferase, ribosomal protein N-acetylase [Bacteroidetes bacterium]|nr:acetyltransferase, ribosomal protein N-acetylase [Bacteroidota bacterium]
MQAFDLTKDYILEDERVLLRPLLTDDIEYLVNFSITQPEIWKYSLIQAGGGPEKMKKYLDIAMLGKANLKEYPFIVFDKKAQKYAGSTRFYDIQLENQALQLGYTWYGKEFQGTGLNKHCKFLLLQFAFEQMEMHRVEFRADHNNAKSIAAMKSIGCVVEGFLRENVPNPDGSRRTSIILSILRQEWDGGVKDRLRERL